MFTNVIIIIIIIIIGYFISYNLKIIPKSFQYSSNIIFNNVYNTS